MTQLAKTIYFPDYPKAATGRSGLTVPFPDGFQAAICERGCQAPSWFEKSDATKSIV
jgi:hypothetical protein